MTKPPSVQRELLAAGSRGLQHHGLRRANQRAVLSLVARHPGISNAEISRLSGLAPQTVSAILVEIEREGLIRRGEVLRGRRGQPATPLFINPGGAYAIGCKIGWRHMRVILIGFDGVVLADRDLDYDVPDPRVVLPAVADAARALMADLSPEQRARLLDFGLTLPTDMLELLDADPAHADLAALWRAEQIEDRLAADTGLRPVLLAEGNAACFGELVRSPARWNSDFLYIYIGECVSAGIVTQSVLLEGPTGKSVDLGRVLTASEASGGPRLLRDCASVFALRRRLASAGLPAADQPLAAWNWSEIAPTFEVWLAEAAAALAQAVVNSSAIVEFRAATLDSPLPAPAVERLVERTNRWLEDVAPEGARRTLLTPGHLGGLAPAFGAAALLVYRRHLSRALKDLTV